MKILQCHTKGDKRFSPFCCYISAFNLTKSIEDGRSGVKERKRTLRLEAIESRSYSRLNFSTLNDRI
jgi:hypothetical protein